MELTDAELRFYSRQIVLDEIGYEGQQKLKKSKVCIAGLGGLGSTVAIQLTAMGVGHLRLVDRDFVEESNLQRQHLYSFDSIGFPKVEAAVKKLGSLNPYVELEPLPISLSERNTEETLKEMDVVVDGLDSMKTRYAVNRASLNLRIPYVFGAAISTFGNVSTIIPHETACLECFYGNLEDKNLPSCGTVGVHPSVLGIIASLEVAETIRLLTAKKPMLANKLLYCDLGSMRFEEIALALNVSCPVCGPEKGSQPAALEHLLVEEECGRNGRRVFVVAPEKKLNLNLENLPEMLKKDAGKIEVVSRLGLTFSTEKGLRGSLLKSGIMVVEGAKTKSEALEFFKGIVVKKLGAPFPD
jgi:adenylyltransferase/sulfurtransferase